MRTYQKIASLSKELTLDQQKEILGKIQEMLNQKPAGHKDRQKTEVRTYDKTPNPDCVFCSGEHVKKIGKKDGRQRYQCLSCGKTFSETTHTIMENSHASKDKWRQVIADTVDGNPLDHTAEVLGIHHETAFVMRHKVLLGIVKYLESDPVVLKEVAELDETYVLESLKGKKFPEDAPRKPRRHGAKAEKRGLSNEQICICTEVQRNQGAAYASTINRSQPTGDEIQLVFQGHIESGSVLFTDGAKGYRVLENDIDCAVEGVNVKEQKKRRVTNLNNVNSFRSFIKDRYGRYRGVATKYLNRYNALFCSCFRDRKAIIDRLCDALLVPGTIDYAKTGADVEDHELLDL